MKIEFDKDEIRVVHNKRQKQMRTDGVQGEYDFEWELIMTFDSDVSNLQRISFSICEISFHESASEGTKRSLLQLFDPYIHFQ